MATTASPPTIIQDLPLFGKVTYTQGELAEPLVVEAIVADGGTVSYQWYRSGTDVSPKIAGATSNSYTPPTDQIGSRSYHCEIMNKNPAGLVAWAYSNSVTVTVVASGSGGGGGSHTHSYSAVVTDPTCAESGYIVYECDCGDSYRGSAIPATGHQWDGNTCTECGVTRTGKRSNVVNFFAGLMMGQQIKRIPVREPVVPDVPETASLYLYGTPSTTGNIGLRNGDSVTRYDGAVLPPLPKWDVEKYPYAVIREGFNRAGSNEYVHPTLFCADSPWICQSTTTPYYWGQVSGGKAIFAEYDGSSAWGEFAEVEDEIYMPVFWSNENITLRNEPDTVILYGSDPIPVTGIVDYNGDIPIYE